jgi:eukaryotic-like serine/threonine-protein kinase
VIPAPPDRWARLEEVLDRAMDEDPSEWPALVEAACSGDPALRAEALELLDRLRAGAVDGFLDALPLAESDPLPGSTIGPWRVVRELARGGMGQVFLARRSDGRFDLEVAVKVLHPLLFGEEARSRFSLERRILAGLAHPGIARILDAGETPDGRPYLVTELVDGHPLPRHLEEARPSIARRLDLFRQVADAVAHAHRNLLIHGDLKPSNILVTTDGHAKLVDFGIAHRVGAPPDGSRRWLTPEFAAPEQRQGEDLTTATDVFQLGLLLRSTLEGSSPTTPPPPGTLLEDLQWVIRKATSDDPALRYPSADALLSDVERACATYPVNARPATRRYRLARFLRRRRRRGGVGRRSKGLK